VPIGQVEGLLALRALEPVILSVAGKASHSSLDDLGSATIYADIAAMKHEVQISRIFRS
jgi:urease accessory protein